MNLSMKSILASLALAGLFGGIAQAAPDKPRITMIIYTSPGVNFFDPLLKGANDAAKQLNVDLDIQYANNDQATENNIIQTAIANKVDGIAAIIWDDNAFNKSVCDATDAGIPVIAFNIDHSQGAKAGNCRLAFIGQDFPATGYLIGKRMIEAAHLKAGDLVFTPVEFPDAVYATKRHEGVQKALDEVGAKSEMIGTGGDLPQVLTKEVQYLIGHPEVKAVIGLGAQPMIEIVPAMKQAGVKVPVGGFDLSKEILQGIEDGDITATVDQQPYSQGYYAVVQLAQKIRYGLYPSDMNTGGNGMVDKTNYKFAATLAGQYR
jgi:simple sugar transport system substrate-binding protein